MDGISQEVPTEVAEVLRQLEAPLDGLVKSVTSSGIGIVYVKLRRPLGRVRITTIGRSSKLRPHLCRYNLWLGRHNPSRLGLHFTPGGKAAHHYDASNLHAMVEDIYKHARHMLYGGPRERPTPLRRERPESPQSEVVLRP